jgi:DNA-binding NtrC family response regulator
MILPALPGFERAAASEAPILILGEAGTGRSALARRIHASSPRRGGPCVEIDLAAVPSTLLESELFGHRAGAFTGAAADAPGRVAAASGGTLVLDRIEGMSLSAQAKLLRLLAERRYSPLGGAEVTADLRFVAIGDEDLEGRVEAGHFRRDLFHRLEVLVFRLPPLRERLEELPAIADELLADLNSRLDRPPARLDPRAAAALARHPWPGNLRELRNVLERSILLGPDADLSLLVPAAAGAPPVRSLRAVEADAIRAALAHTRGRQAAAAALLGISRKSLWERRRRYQIP